MKTAVFVVISLLAISRVALADDPESLVIEAQLREADLLIKATEAAVAIPTLASEESDVAKQKYRISDYLDELMMIACHRLADLLSDAPNEKWTHTLTKAQWAERLIEHFLDHHAGSANEGWMIMCEIYMHDTEVTADLFQRLQERQQDRLIADLKSPFEGCGSEACLEFAASLEKLR